MKKAIIITCSILAFLAFFSFLHTNTYGELYWPGMELLVHIRDIDGKPIQGAVAQLYEDKMPSQRLHRRHFYPCDLISDKNGNLRFLVKPRRWQQDGWRLFWLIPIGHVSPIYNIRIECAGYHTQAISFAVFFEDRFLAGKRAASVDEKTHIQMEEELEVFKSEIVLNAV